MYSAWPVNVRMGCILADMQSLAQWTLHAFSFGSRYFWLNLLVVAFYSTSSIHTQVLQLPLMYRYCVCESHVDFLDGIGFTCRALNSMASS